ncbi:MAG: aminotransferase class V-fold PLP-dependent enzyme [Candidatus Kapaibacteriales bacterium]
MTDFNHYRINIIGYDAEYQTPYGVKPLIYADWTASGRMYRPIEESLINDFAPFVANTHTLTSYTGAVMTSAYSQAQQIIKKHVGATDDHCLIATGSGMTGAVSKFQRMLGLKLPSKLSNFASIPKEERPVVFITHMEHHSNQTSWLETICDVQIIDPNDEGLPDLNDLEFKLRKFRKRKAKFASVTACSNVTGIQTPYHDIAKLMHDYGGYCFVDFACSAPYVDINMLGNGEEGSHLDAIFFSPHKFLGGPGAPGILVFDKTLYNSEIPDEPGGGTVTWTDPWGVHLFYENIELREDSGTPAFLQTIKTSLAVKLKESMDTKAIAEREHTINRRLFSELSKIDGLHILADHHQDRLSIFSFVIEGMHYNLATKILSDKYGIQVRGGCSCAGTYGHYLLNLTPRLSRSIYDEVIGHNDIYQRPGWVRLSLHPTITDSEIDYIVDSLSELVAEAPAFSKDYDYCKNMHTFYNKNAKNFEQKVAEDLFDSSIKSISGSSVLEVLG